MVKYKIIKDSVEFDGKYTRFKVSFDGRKEELFEVKGSSARSVYAALDKAAMALKALGEKSASKSAPSFEEDKVLAPGEAIKRLPKEDDFGAKN